MSRKKKFVVEIDEKYVDQKKHQMVTYIIGKAYDKKFIRHNMKKKIVGRWSPEKNLFSTGGKKKSLQTTKTLGLPQISNAASPTGYQKVNFHFGLLFHRWTDYNEWQLTWQTI